MWNQPAPDPDTALTVGNVVLNVLHAATLGAATLGAATTGAICGAAALIWLTGAFYRLFRDLRRDRQATAPAGRHTTRT